MTVKDKVFGFEVAMYDFVSVEILERENYVGNKEFGLFLTEKWSISQMVAKISSVEVVHDEIEVFSVLERVGHVDNKGMAKFCQEVSFIQHRRY